MKKKYIIVSKDACGKFYFPVYGNDWNSTPNIDELADKGTVFRRHYTVSPSTVMSFTGMLTGDYPYKTERKDYVAVSGMEKYVSWFDRLHDKGYTCHMIWPKGWKEMLGGLYGGIFGSSVVFHSADVEQKVGTRFPHERLVSDPAEVERCYERVTSVINEADADEKELIWLHLPHVIRGYTGYGTDLDFMDRVVGYMRERFGDDSIFVMADHGNMNYTHGKTGYGFDLFEPAVQIPLITPRINGQKEVETVTTNADIFKIITGEEIPEREYIVLDSAYYCQPHRKLAVLCGSYKYIYNKTDGSEELYDVVWDPHEDRNIISEFMYDRDRKGNLRISDLYYYPKWKEALEIVPKLRAIKDGIWREETKSEFFRRFLKKGFPAIGRKIARILHIKKPA